MTETKVYDWSSLKYVGDIISVYYDGDKELQSIKRSSYRCLKSRNLKRGFKVRGNFIEIEVAGFIEDPLDAIAESGCVNNSEPISGQEAYNGWKEQQMKDKKEFIDSLSKEECQSLLLIALKAIS